MGLEALPGQWHLLHGSSPRPSRPAPSLLADAVLDGTRNPFTRRSSDASDCSPRGSSSRRPQASHRASVDGGAPSPGFPSRAPWSGEKGLKGGPSSSSFRRTEFSWLGQGLPEQGCPPGLFRWKSDAGGLMRRATRFEDFPGDRWRRPDNDFCEAEPSYQGFGRFDVDVVDPSLQEAGRAGWARSEAAHYESQGLAGGGGEREPGSAAEVSAVDVTAPSFVKDRQFMDRSEHHPRGGGGAVSRLESNLVDQQVDDAVKSMARPASLKRKTAAKVCNSGDNSTRLQSVDRVETKLPLGLGARVECLAIPDSLRKLRRRNGQQRAGGEGVCAMKKAFDSMVFMIRALQSYTLQLRQTLVADMNVQHLMSMVHREMHSSFVWLFQQVFSGTPTLMVSVMVLLANFTVYSLGNNVAMGAVMAPEPPTELVSTLPNHHVERAARRSFVRVDRSLDPSEASSTPHDSAGQGFFGNYGTGGVGGGSIIVAGGEDGNYNARGAPSRNAMFSEKEIDSVDFLKHPSAGHGSLHLPKDTMRALLSPKSPGVGHDKSTIRTWTDPAQPASREEERSTSSTDRLRSYRLLLEQTVRELDLKPGEPYHHVQLDQETLRILVAPVATKMESDDYLCFDRTDLEYQHAIRAEPFNAMLLANYAQFLYAVRHDNARAETFFHRALRVDSEDGDTLGRWASFLWLALKDRARADMAYREAISLDPSNPFHAGSYAHFLWHADDDEGSAGQLKPSSL